jgi:ribosomal protein L40E
VISAKGVEFKSDKEDLYASKIVRETVEFGKVCRACGSKNARDARCCAKCGARLEVVEDSAATGFIDDDPALRHIDANNRVELERFERMDEAEFACGLLRSHGIACELSSPVLPGLPADMILWVHNRDAGLAWALLADSEREASSKDDDCLNRCRHLL